MMRPVSLFLFFLTFSNLTARADSEDMAIVRNRMVESYITAMQDDPAVQKQVKYITDNTDGTDVVIRELAEGANDSLTRLYLAGFGKDSLWPDIDYASQQRGAWPPAMHIQRLSNITRSYLTLSSPYYKKPEASKILHRGLNKWFDMGLIAPNWWYNEIGGPRFMAPVLLMLAPELSPQEMQRGIQYMAQAKIGMTGQNRTWLAGNVLVRALLERDDSLMQVARDVIMSEVRVADEGKEGIQPDASFHQHGPQQQFGNYGLAYALGITWWGRIFSGTKFALNEEQVRVMRRFVIDGMSKVIRNGVMDVSSCGRQLFPYTPEGKALGFGKVLLDMAVLDAEKSAEYRALYDQLIKGRKIKGLNQGFTHFHHSDMSVYRMADRLVTLKMSSPRTVGAEVVNGENLLGYQMADGALFAYRTGYEFENVFGVFDYTQVPGITSNVPYDTCVPFQNGSYAEFRGGNAFAGGVAGAQRGGVSAMILEKNALKANKAWFFFDGLVVCRGSGINSPRVEGRPVRTSVVQQLKQEGDTLAPSFRIGGATYEFVNGTLPKVEAKAGPVTGNWARFATMYRGTEDVTMEMVDVVINHGFEPKDESYDYVMRLGGSLQAYALKENGAGIRGVEWRYRTDGKERWQRDVVFFEPGSLKFDDQAEITVSAPVIVSWGDEGVVRLVEPTQGLDQGLDKVEVTIKPERGKARTLIFDTRGVRGATLTRSVKD